MDGDGKVNGRVGSRPFCWLVILLSAVGIICAGFVMRHRNVEQGDGTHLLVLTIQAKILVAADSMSPGAMAAELPELDELVYNPETARAVAALNAVLSEDDGWGTTRAYIILEEHLPSPDDEDGLGVHEAVTAAIEDPSSLTEEQSKLVVEELGWIGQLLLTRDRPDTDPERADILAQADLAGMVSLGLLAFFLTGLIAGVLLWLAYLLLHLSQRAGPLFKPAATDDRPYLQAFAVYFLLLFLLSILPGVVGIGGTGLSLAGLTVASLAGVLWPLVLGAEPAVVSRDLGFHTGRGLVRELAAGVAGYAALIPLLAVGVLMTLGLMSAYEWLFPPSPLEPHRLVAHPVAHWLAESDTPTRLGILFLACGFAPFFEETMFRGAIHRVIRGRRGRLLSSLAVALLFASIHPQGPFLIPALTSLAFGFAMLREWRDSLVAPMTAHAVHNGVLVAFLWLMFA